MHVAHPHPGKPEDVQQNQDLVAGFLTAAHTVLLQRPGAGSGGDPDGAAGGGKRQRVEAGAGGGTPAGEVHITLRRTPFYDSWGIDAIAKAAG